MYHNPDLKVYIPRPHRFHKLLYKLFLSFRSESICEGLGLIIVFYQFYCEMGDMEKCCDFSVLHMDLKEEILAWLPIESVCRFRSVSKEWNGILSREFITNKWVKKAPNRDPSMASSCARGKIT